METLTPQEVRQALGQSHVGHLGLARGGHAYVIPIFYAYDGNTIFFHSHPGLKEEFMDATEEACLAVVRIAGEDTWTSVQVFGKVARVRLAGEHTAAMDALLSLPLPPELGFDAEGNPKRSGHNMFFWKLAPDRVTGRKSIRPPENETIETV